MFSVIITLGTEQRSVFFFFVCNQAFLTLATAQACIYSTHRNIVFPGVRRIVFISTVLSQRYLSRFPRRSVGGGVAALSFDEEFQRRRIRRRREAGGAGTNRRGGRNGAQGAARMLVHAVRDLGGGVYHGVTGVIVEPYCRARVSTGRILWESGNEELCRESVSVLVRLQLLLFRANNCGQLLFFLVLLRPSVFRGGDPCRERVHVWRAVNFTRTQKKYFPLRRMLSFLSLLFPLFGQQDDGIRGLAAGIFQGLAGVATKPMVGCLDAVTHTGEAVREMAGGLAGDGALASRRSRLPQPFGPDGRMMPRTVETAYGTMILAKFPMWKVRG